MALHIGDVTRETAVSLRRNLLMTLAGILTVAVSLFLFGGVLLLSRMVDHGTARWKNGVELEIFLCSKSTAEPDSIRFQATTLTWSRCYAQSRGELDCVTCHDPHRDAETSASFYEVKCLDCHGPTAASRCTP